MRSEIDNLKKELSAKDSREDNEEKRQLALMEKSYQMAARYLPKASAAAPSLGNDFTEDKGQTATNKGQSMGSNISGGSADLPAMEILAERKQVVSSLGQPMSDADFIKEYGTKARNLGFHSLASAAAPTMRNTLKVVVDRTTVLKEGDNVVLRLLESAKVEGLRIPRQSRLIAVAKIEGNRMHLLIKSVEVDGHIMPSSSRHTTQTDKRACIYQVRRISMRLRKLEQTSVVQWEPPLPSLPLPRTRLSPRLPVG